MAITYVMAYWDEEGTLFWTPFLDYALGIKEPKGKIPDHCNWLPVFIPEINK